MESLRQQKVGRLLQKELGAIFLLDSKNMPGVLVTVTEVRVSPDLSYAKVFLSIFPSEKGKEIIKSIKTNTKSLRYELGTKIGKQLRIVPDLGIHLDESLDYLENIDNLLKNDKDKHEDNEE